MRYEIRETELSDYVKELTGRTGPHFSVWDTLTGKKVPFGGYGDRERAQARVDRMDPEAPVMMDVRELLVQMGREDRNNSVHGRYLHTVEIRAILGLPANGQ